MNVLAKHKISLTILHIDSYCINQFILMSEKRAWKTLIYWGECEWVWCHSFYHFINSWPKCLVFSCRQRKLFQCSRLSVFVSCRSMAPSWPGPVRAVSQDFVELPGEEIALLSFSIVLWPLSLVCRKGGQGTASDTFRNLHTKAGIPARFFSLCWFREEF